MSITTYSELKTAVDNWLERTDLTGRVDEFIDIAEARHKREVRIREMLSRSSLTVNARQISLPSDYLEAQHIRLLTDPVTVLTEVNLHEMSRLRDEGTGKPTRFTIHTEIEFDITPDSSYSGEIIYYGEFTALSDANPTNALLTRALDVYLYAALSASAPFLMHDERLKVWESLYQDARDTLNRSDSKSRKVGPLVSRVAGDTP